VKTEMEQLKVKKKDVLALNMVLYLILSFLFLYLQYAYRHHLSPFSLAYLRKSLELFWYISVPILFAMVLIWRHHRWSLVVYASCIFLVSFKVVEGLFIEFNKIIVIALFCYAVISYFLYQLFKYYLNLASLNANYSGSDLFDPLLRKIPCTVMIQDLPVEGELTNWDEEGCFIRLKEPRKGISAVEVIIDFHGRRFVQKGEVVAHSMDFQGIGLNFERTQKGFDVFNWSEFTELVHELGFKPERLR
jgi:hypothetical protein